VSGFGDPLSMKRATPWSTNIMSARAGDAIGHGVFLHVGEYWLVCVAPETKLPTVFDHATAASIAGCVNKSLMELLLQSRPVLGEMMGDEDQVYIYLYVPRDSVKGYRFVVIDFQTKHPVPCVFSSKKGAFARLGDLIDILSCGTIDWCNMSIPAET